MVKGEERKSLRVEVVYALPAEQAVVSLELEDGATVAEAIERSGLVGRFPEIAAAPAVVGIFGRRTTPGARVQDGDRIEIYRPLTADPKEVRRARAKLRGRKKPAS